MNELAGASLGGRYRLEQWLGGDEQSAFFLTSLGDGLRAVVKLIPEEQAAAGQIEMWRRTAALSHPNLLPLLDYGREQVDGRPFLFAVFEYPDDTLSNALAQGPLSDTESHEAWNATVEALRYLHSQGLVHGAVNAENIVAAGSRIKLASDALREPAGGCTAAEDFRALGQIGLLPAAATPIPPPPVEKPRRVPKAAWALAACVAIVALAALWHGSLSGRKAAPAPAPAAKTPTTASPAKTPAPVSHAAPAPAASAEARTDPAPTGDWRVIAYTYYTLRDAQKKADRINQRHATLRAAVFTPNGKGHGPYLVSLGDRMSRAEALRVQKYARAKGLPRDTFIRNYRR